MNKPNEMQFVGVNGWEERIPPKTEEKLHENHVWKNMDTYGISKEGFTLLFTKDKLSSRIRYMVVLNEHHEYGPYRLQKWSTKEDIAKSTAIIENIVKDDEVLKSYEEYVTDVYDFCKALRDKVKGQTITYDSVELEILDIVLDWDLRVVFSDEHGEIQEFNYRLVQDEINTEMEIGNYLDNDYYYNDVFEGINIS